MSKFKTTLSDTTRINTVDWNKLGFGKYFSDHVFVSDFIDGKWTEGEIIPYGNMMMEPGLCTLHYGQTIFEGLKAYRNQSGGANIFRPDKNAKRLNRSATRLCIPEIDENMFIEAIKQLVEIDKSWVPTERGHSLYIRPLMYGSGNFLGVHNSDTYRFIVMTSPVASYYAEGLSPIKILVAHDLVRAVRGGMGMAKTAANYAASLLGASIAKKEGFAQVLWLDGVTMEYVDEVGAMNIMFVIGDEIITPPLTQGTILDGVTRDTVMHLAKEKGIRVTERQIKVQEIYDAHKNGTLQEVFGTGTAAVISPVGLLSWKGESITINNNEIGKYARMFYDDITKIQHGEVKDEHNWTVHVEI